jgi:hypothetical protein
MEVVNDQPQRLSSDDRIRGQDALTMTELDLISCEPATPAFFSLAAHSSRKCGCEGRDATSKHEILICTSCQHSACRGCAGRPEHHFIADASIRQAPNDFIKQVKRLLPMTFRLDGFSLEALTSHVEAFKASFSIDENIIKSFVATVSESINQVDVSYDAFRWMD